MMESGIASPDQWAFSRTDTLGSDQDFVDALEVLHVNGYDAGRSSCPTPLTSPKS